MNKKFFALAHPEQEAILNAGFLCDSHRTLIRRALQVKLLMLQVSVNPYCFTIFTTKRTGYLFYGKIKCADCYHGGEKKRLL